MISAAISGSVLKTAAHNESFPGALLFPRVVIAAQIMPQWLLLLRLLLSLVGTFLSPGLFLQAGCLLGVVDPVCLALR